jgi:hypothetical protein
MLLPYLAEERMAILAPAKSAGVEGTGSGQQMDAETEKLEKATAGPTEEDVEAALQGRLERGEELLQHLVHFTAIDFYHMNSTQPTLIKEEETVLERTITMKGRLSEGVEELQIVLNVREVIGEGAIGGPQIVNMDVDMGEELYRALEEDHLQR